MANSISVSPRTIEVEVDPTVVKLITVSAGELFELNGQVWIRGKQSEAGILTCVLVNSDSQAGDMEDIDGQVKVRRLTGTLDLTDL